MSSPLVVITGAAGALGHAVSEAFLAQGASVIALDVDQRRLHEVFEGQARVHTLAVDLTDADASQAALGAMLAERGAAAVLCNIAGGFDMGPAVHDSTDAFWRRLVDLNVATVINASRAVVPGMLRAGAGRIVNVAAASAVTGKGGMGAYCAAKSGVARLTESMAAELREQGINVNAVAPSILDTPANRAAMPGGDFGKWVTLADLAAVIEFLASPRARAIHGAVLPVVGLS
ncbi:MAG: SDR family NAD(P)-dependent oxidoreductase [Janthinobacterium lividum]